MYSYVILFINEISFVPLHSYTLCGIVGKHEKKFGVKGRKKIYFKEEKITSYCFGSFGEYENNKIF